MVSVLPAAGAGANPAGVTALCTNAGGATTLCTCASERLLSDVGPDEFALYGRVGAAYLAKRGSGMKMGEAWNGAVGEEASRQGAGNTAILGVTNDIGRAHQEAIKSCAG